MPSARRIQTFQATDTAGRSYRINEMQEFDGDTPITTLMTTDQRPVEYLAKGRYRIKDGCIELKAVEPDTAP